MSFNRPLPPPDAPAYVEPTRCPFCRSIEISTISKVADITSYWRCKQCGEVWNDSRGPRRAY
jgi:transposase-like protein